MARSKRRSSKKGRRRLSAKQKAILAAGRAKRRENLKSQRPRRRAEARAAFRRAHRPKRKGERAVMLRRRREQFRMTRKQRGYVAQSTRALEAHYKQAKREYHAAGEALKASRA